MGNIRQMGKKPVANGKNSIKGGFTSYSKHGGTIRGKAFDIFDTQGKANAAPYFETKKRSKFVPKGIDPAYPNRNFVKMHYVNSGNMEGWYDHLYDLGRNDTQNRIKEVPSRYRGERKLGNMRLSGSSKAHRIGARKK